MKDADFNSVLLGRYNHKNFMREVANGAVLMDKQMAEDAAKPRYPRMFTIGQKVTSFMSSHKVVMVISEIETENGYHYYVCEYAAKGKIVQRRERQKDLKLAC